MFARLCAPKYQIRFDRLGTVLSSEQREHIRCALVASVHRELREEDMIDAARDELLLRYRSCGYQGDPPPLDPYLY